MIFGVRRIMMHERDVDALRTGYTIQGCKLASALYSKLQLPVTIILTASFLYNLLPQSVRKNDVSTTEKDAYSTVGQSFGLEHTADRLSSGETFTIIEKVDFPEREHNIISRTIETAGEWTGSIIDWIFRCCESKKDLDNAIEHAMAVLEYNNIVQYESSDSEKKIVTIKTVSEWKEFNLIIHDNKTLAQTYILGKAIEKIDPSAVELFYQGVSYIDETNNVRYFSSREEMYKLCGFENEKEFIDYINDYICNMDDRAFTMSNNSEEFERDAHTKVLSI